MTACAVERRVTRTRHRPAPLGPLPQHDIDEFLLEARVRQIVRARRAVRVWSIWWEAWSRLEGCRIVEMGEEEAVVVPIRRPARPLQPWADYSVGVPGSRTERGWLVGDELPEYGEWFVSRLLIDPRVVGILMRADVAWAVETPRARRTGRWRDEHPTTSRSEGRPQVNDVGVNEIREAARIARTRHSTRKLAAQMEISPAGLRDFLRGVNPYPHTRGKLRQWYARWAAKATADAVAAAMAGLGIVLEMVPVEVRPTARTRVLDALRRACAEHGHKLPQVVEEGFRKIGR